MEIFLLGENSADNSNITGYFERNKCTIKCFGYISSLSKLKNAVQAAMDYNIVVIDIASIDGVEIPDIKETLSKFCVAYSGFIICFSPGANEANDRVKMCRDMGINYYVFGSMGYTINKELDEILADINRIVTNRLNEAKMREAQQAQEQAQAQSVQTAQSMGQLTLDMGQDVQSAGQAQKPKSASSNKKKTQAPFGDNRQKNPNIQSNTQGDIQDNTQVNSNQAQNFQYVPEQKQPQSQQIQQPNNQYMNNGANSYNSANGYTDQQDNVPANPPYEQYQQYQTQPQYQEYQQPMQPPQSTQPMQSQQSQQYYVGQAPVQAEQYQYNQPMQNTQPIQSEQVMQPQPKSGKMTRKEKKAYKELEKQKKKAKRDIKESAPSSVDFAPSDIPDVHNDSQRTEPTVKEPAYSDYQDNTYSDYSYDERTNAVNTVNVGVIGIMPHIGATTQALLLTRFFQSIGKRACYVQNNGSTFISDMLNYFDDVYSDDERNCIVHKEIDLFENPAYLTGTNYEYRIFDYGYAKQNIPADFFNNQIRIVVCGSKAQEVAKLTNLGEQLYPDEEAIYLFTSVPEYEQADILGMMSGRNNNCYFVPYSPDCFNLSEESLMLFATALNMREYIPDNTAKGKKERKKKR